MPARSKAQQEAMAIAEHEPSKLYAKNKGLLNMSHSQLHDFAATPRKELPERVKPMRRSGPRHHAQAGMPRVLGGKQG